MGGAEVRGAPSGVEDGEAGTGLLGCSGKPRERKVSSLPFRHSDMGPYEKEMLFSGLYNGGEMSLEMKTVKYLLVLERRVVSR